MSKTTLQEVAEAAGVSLGTASRAINEQGKVSTDAYRRVWDAARKLGYVSPGRKDIVIGILIPTLEIPELEHYFLRVFNQLRNEIHRRGYRALIVSREDFGLFSERQISGVISMDYLQRASLEFPLAKSIPLVCYCDKPNHWENVYSVRSDRRDIIRRAVDHLVELGHIRIGFCRYMDKRMREELLQQEKYFKDAMKAHGLESSAFFQYHDRALRYSDAIGMLLQKRITALIAFEEGVRAHRILNIFGKRIPEDISLVSGDTIVSNDLYPRHTTIGQDYPAMVKAALDILEAFWRGEEIREDVVVKSLLTIRESSGPAPGAAARTSIPE